MYSDHDSSSRFFISDQRFVGERNIHKAIENDGLNPALGYGLLFRGDGSAEEEIAFSNLENAVLATQSSSNDKKRLAAMKHLDYYLQNSGVNEFYFSSHKDVRIEDLNDDLVGKYTTYLGVHARSYRNPTNKLIKWLTSVGYLCGFKSFFEIKFKDKDRPKVFEEQNFKRYYTALRKYKTAQARVSGEVSFY